MQAPQSFRRRSARTSDSRTNCDRPRPNTKSLRRMYTAACKTSRKPKPRRSRISPTSWMLSSNTMRDVLKSSVAFVPPGQHPLARSRPLAAQTQTSVCLVELLDLEATRRSPSVSATIVQNAGRLDRISTRRRSLPPPLFACLHVLCARQAAALQHPSHLPVLALTDPARTVAHSRGRATDHHTVSRHCHRRRRKHSASPVSLLPPSPSMLARSEAILDPSAESLQTRPRMSLPMITTRLRAAEAPTTLAVKVLPPAMAA